ncbi:tetratricopeptide repeat protein [Hyphomonas sp.]|jgi:tetratricopeptide (TPR) repeat protein|uniref:tetratricopeptide repeat protein n=1 Tax=Hyphomonas sp. TaxID=87 RepID=UPI0025BBDAEB|nr:tetratricopeptide repeat protein [Hyphomonas sp.]
MFRTILIAAAIAIAAPAASAQVTVIGGGIARDCYEAVKFNLGRTQDAEETCTRALELEALNISNKAATYTNRGVLRMRQGEYDAALQDYASAKRIKPGSGATWLNEGAAFIFKKDYNSALVSLEKAIELNSEDLYAAYYNRAIAKEHTGDVQGAYFDFVKSKELNPEFAATDRQLARFTVTTN